MVAERGLDARGEERRGEEGRRRTSYTSGKRGTRWSSTFKSKYKRKGDSPGRRRIDKSICWRERERERERDASVCMRRHRLSPCPPWIYRRVPSYKTRGGRIQGWRGGGAVRALVCPHGRVPGVWLGEERGGKVGRFRAKVGCGESAYWGSATGGAERGAGEHGGVRGGDAGEGAAMIVRRWRNDKYAELACGGGSSGSTS